MGTAISRLATKAAVAEVVDKVVVAVAVEDLMVDMVKRKQDWPAPGGRTCSWLRDKDEWSVVKGPSNKVRRE